MDSIKRASLLAFLLTLPLMQVFAASPVWMVEKSGSRLYLAGSVHFLSDADYPLPAAFETAYSRSQVVVFETDIQQIQSPAGSQRVLQRLSYAAGGSLREDVSDSTYGALEAFFSQRGMSMAQVDGFRPGMVAMLISVIELQQLGLAGDGVDVYYYNRALGDKRQLLQLEGLDEQIDFLANMGKGREDELLNYTLREATSIASLMSSVKKSWRNGNLDGLDSLVVEPMVQDFPRIYENLLVRRNRNWLPRLEKMLADDSVEFVVVGAAHLVGKQGLLSLLEKRGYRVEQLP